MFTRWKANLTQCRRSFLSFASKLRELFKWAFAKARTTLKLYYRHCRFELYIAYDKTHKKLKQVYIRIRIAALRKRVQLQFAAYDNLECCKKYSATLLSVVLAVVFFCGVPEHVIYGADFKASEVHLACAGVIGMALVLVLTLAIKAADVFAPAILKLYAKDRNTIVVFSALSCTTLISELLGTNWTLDLDRRWTLAVQFILLGLSLDSVKHFYSRALELLIPETALELVKGECKKEIVRIRREVDRATRIHIFETGSREGLNVVRALLYASSRISSRLRVWIGVLDEIAHKAIIRRDTQATNAVIATLGTIVREYLNYNHSRNDPLSFLHKIMMKIF